MSKIPPREKDNDGNRVRASLHHLPLKNFNEISTKNYYNSLQHVISFQTQKTPWHPWPERAEEAYQHQNATKNGRARFSECCIPMLWVG